MKESSVTATDAARRLSDLLNRVRYRGESFVIVRNGEEVAQLTPRPAPPPGIALRALLARAAEARTEDPRFATDLEAVQAEQPRPRGSPWDS